MVPKNQFGSILGIEVGMSWLQSIQVSEEGVHRPPVAGIAGKAEEGSQSIVLAGGYEDDEDNGDTFLYTGEGGRDLRELQSRVSTRHCPRSRPLSILLPLPNCNILE